MIRTVYIVDNSSGKYDPVSFTSLHEAVEFVGTMGINNQDIFVVNLDIPQYKASPTEKGEVSVYQLIPNPE